ncbi:Uncharacterized protein FKW44_006554 [Caligus rogercresseyi]|uniref:PiggyBac transposable element-derived protein domain-containing protein n=1 Tax=Caligus rogercresseyi TaxID=217165 RepID=A0A7T8KDJ1_CALRO|nr:Uncharacterized protein FKW44_006554 [Caligus rogercresseyi]
MSFTVSKEEMKVFLAILICSGYNPLPSKRHYWANGDDLKNHAIYNSMRRNTFEDIMRYIHFISNDHIDPKDKYWKVRPLVKHLQKKFMDNFVPTRAISHDESMIQYFGKHGCKQAIRNKPIPFGYKVWSQCSKSGYLVACDLYQGKSIGGVEEEEKKFGKCSATVLNLLNKYDEQRRNLPYTLYFDNLFTSVPLLVEL